MHVEEQPIESDTSFSHGRRVHQRLLVRWPYSLEYRASDAYWLIQMSSKRHGAVSRGPRKHLTKAMLLPMAEASAREQSLSSHLALVACRDGHGNRHLFNELMRTVYVAWFLQRDGYGKEPATSFKTAEYAVEAALELAHASQEWVLAEDTVPVFERLLALHDWQLATAPLHKVIHAERRLRQFLAGSASSPIPETGQAGMS